MNENLVFALDVDGVLTDGKFHWDRDGEKVYKEFGPDDADALKLLEKIIPVLVFSKDKKGFQISQSRTNHMGLPIYYMDNKERYDFLSKNYGLENVIYMGDSFVDVPLLLNCRCGIATATSSPFAKKVANYITTTGGGERAVAEAVFYIMKTFLDIEYVTLDDGNQLKIKNEEVGHYYEEEEGIECEA